MSSYVKALEGVMRLFPKKINVTFKHVAGHVIGTCKIYEEQLPEKFKRPMLIEAFGRSWRVLEAEPRENKDFVYSRKLSLVVVEPERAGEYVREYFTATIAGTMPEVVAESNYSGDFGVDIGEEEWRQVELLPASCMSTVNEELAVIEGILRPGKGVSVLRGYKKRLDREKLQPQLLEIFFDEFRRVTESSTLGYLRFKDGYVKNGFALRSAGFTYYGIVEVNVIKGLNIYNFDCADYELFNVLATFDLLMVDWCKGKIFTAEVSDKSEVTEQTASSDSANFI